MDPSLQAESEKLARSWMQHEPAWLRDYLVAGVEDPRWNLQSILSRHFLARALSGERFSGLMLEECRFAAVMNWLVPFVQGCSEPEELDAVLHALRQNSDNAEGIEIPALVLHAFGELPAKSTTPPVPNYVESLLAKSRFSGAKAELDRPSLDTFQQLWRTALRDLTVPEPKPTLLEPACGSANDYRFLAAYGLAGLWDYTGFDLCLKNVENARGLFPATRFELGNVLEIQAADKAFEFCLVHDLFEHLSIPAMEVAVREVCRVTRRGLCVGFFQMDEVREHVVRPMDEYHWNLLSMARMKRLFADQGFEAQVIHIGTFLHQQFGFGATHNPNAYTFYLRPAEPT